MLAKNSEKVASQRECAEEFLALDSSHRRAAMAHICFDRIGQKQEFLVDKFHDTDDWSDTAYFMLLRSLDIKGNRSSYERLARIVPYRYICKISHDPQAIEALLLGASGLLPRLVALCSDKREIVELNTLYEYNAHKFSLQRMDVREWQLVGHIGDNHPIVRLLQMANILSQHEYLLNDMLACKTREDVEKFFCATSIPRWAHTFLSDKRSGGAISRTKAHMLGINVVAQMQIFYSEYTLRSDLDSRGVDLLDQLPAESNLIINRWTKLGVKAENALETQALLQLSKEYCASLRCHKCPLRRYLDAD